MHYSGTKGAILSATCSERSIAASTEPASSSPTGVMIRIIAPSDRRLITLSKLV